MNKTSWLLLLLGALGPLLGCAGIVQPAQMRLPPELAARAPEPLQGLGGGRQGRFSLGAEGGSFRRGLDRLVLMDLLARERASSSFEWQRADGSAVQASCRGRQSTASVGVLSARVQPFALDCRFSGALQASLSLAAPAGAALGTRAERSGRFESEGQVLELRSVHEVQGSSLPLAAPIGYTLWQGGRPVGAIELNGGTPRLWRPAEGEALQAPVTLAALALALLWDPAQQE